MDIVSIANEIKNKIDEMEKMRAVIRERAEQKAITIAEYEKKIAKIMIRLKHGEPFELDGVSIEEQLPVTLIEKTARGICWKEKLDMETAEALYKTVIVHLEVVMAQINGLQSINKYLKEV